MLIRALGDSSWETGLSTAMNVLSDSSLKSYFESRHYGPGLNKIGVVFMCRHPSLAFKRRVKMSKKERALCLDIMLDSHEMVNASFERRREIVKDRIVAEIPEVLKKYKIVDFDMERFLSDFSAWANGRASI